MTCVSQGLTYSLKKYIRQDIQINKHKNKVLKKFIFAINTLSKIYKNNTFVIRPHPGDHPLFWKKVFKEKNIKVIFEHDVKTWIHSSKISLNHWCTTSIESYFQNKTVILWRNERADDEELYRTKTLKGVNLKNFHIIVQIVM